MKRCCEPISSPRRLDHRVDVLGELHDLGVAALHSDPRVEVSGGDAPGDPGDRLVAAREPADHDHRDQHRPQQRQREHRRHRPGQEARVAVEVAARRGQQHGHARVRGDVDVDPAQVLVVRPQVEARRTNRGQPCERGGVTSPRRRLREDHPVGPVERAVLGQRADVVGRRAGSVADRQLVAAEARGLRGLLAGLLREREVQLPLLAGVDRHRDRRERAAQRDQGDRRDRHDVARVQAHGRVSRRR
jgi:hypothetical protein